MRKYQSRKHRIKSGCGRRSTVYGDHSSHPSRDPRRTNTPDGRSAHSSDKRKWRLGIFVVRGIVSFFYSAKAQEYNLLRGYVTDTLATPLPGVVVRLKNGGGTTTDEAGRYELRLETGVYRLSFQYIGFKTVTLDQLVEGNTTLNVAMEVDENQLQTVNIFNNRKDFCIDANVACDNLSHRLVRKWS